MKIVTSLALAATICLISGCADNRGPGERAGARIDEISDNIAEGRAPLHKAGPVEKAGRSVDRTLNKTGRAIEDATDND
jgi:hypothetical protein